MKIISKIKKFMNNNDNDTSLETQLIMASLLIGNILGTITFFSNFFLKLGLSTVLVSFVIIITSSFLFYISKYKGKHKISSYITVLLLCSVLYPITWFVNGGSYGGIIYFYIFSAVFIGILFKKNMSILIFIIHLITVMLLYYIEYLFPNSITLYANTKRRSLDLAITFFMVYISLFALVKWVMRIYDQKIQELNKAHTELNIAYDRLKIISITDTLSNIYNRRHTFDLLENLFKNKTISQNISILMIDIDHFKKINDNYGHSIGDEVIKKVAKILKENIKINDFTGRIGGEEFLIIFTNLSSIEAENTANKIKNQISNLTWNYSDLHVTISGGIFSCHSSDNIKVDKAIELADKFLYMAKNRGRNCIVANPIQ